MSMKTMHYFARLMICQITLLVLSTYEAASALQTGSQRSGRSYANAVAMFGLYQTFALEKQKDYDFFYGPNDDNANIDDYPPEYEGFLNETTSRLLWLACEYQINWHLSGHNREALPALPEGHTYFRTICILITNRLDMHLDVYHDRMIVKIRRASEFSYEIVAPLDIEGLKVVRDEYLRRFNILSRSSMGEQFHSPED